MNNQEIAALKLDAHDLKGDSAPVVTEVQDQSLSSSWGSSSGILQCLTTYALRSLLMR